MPLKIHACTEEDWDNFYEPSASVKDAFNEVLTKKVFHCLDPWEEQDLQGLEPNLSGMYEYQANQSLSVIFQPNCTHGENGDECKHTLK